MIQERDPFSTRIVVIGAGVSGISCSILLQKHGFRNVHLYDKDEHVQSRRQGYGLTLMQGISALKRMGVFEAVLELDRRAVHITSLTATEGLHNLRMSLYGKLADSNCPTEWNKRAVEISKNEDSSLKISFSDDSSVDADLVVGCDGIQSVVRRCLIPTNLDNPLNYLGIMVVLGITSCSSHFLTHDRIFQTIDGNARLYVMPHKNNKYEDDECIMWQLSFPVDEDAARSLSKDISSLKSCVFEMCRNWHDPVPYILSSTSPELLMGIPVYDRDPSLPIGHAKFENVALLGDASHPMSPFKGQGANQALLDAASLVDHLAKWAALDGSLGGLGRSIALLHQVQVDRVKSKVEKSRERATSYHSPGALDPTMYLYEGISVGLINKLGELGLGAKFSGDSLEREITTHINRN